MNTVMLTPMGDLIDDPIHIPRIGDHWEGHLIVEINHCLEKIDREFRGSSHGFSRITRHRIELYAKGKNKGESE